MERGIQCDIMIGNMTNPDYTLFKNGKFSWIQQFFVLIGIIIIGLLVYLFFLGVLNVKYKDYYNGS